MPQPAGPKHGLDRAAVLQAAVRLVNAEGADALSLNRLARELGVKPPSLYNHIDGLAGLWRELAIENITALGDRVSQASIGKTGPAGIRALAAAYRAHIRECPDLYLASLRSSANMESPDPRLQAAEERVVQVALTMVASFGLSGDDAIHAVRALRSAIHGYATLEAAGGFGLLLDRDVSFDRLIDLVVRGLENAQQANR